MYIVNIHIYNIYNTDYFCTHTYIYIIHMYMYIHREYYTLCVIYFNYRVHFVSKWTLQSQKALGSHVRGYEYGLGQVPYSLRTVGVAKRPTGLSQGYLHLARTSLPRQVSTTILPRGSI